MERFKAFLKENWLIIFGVLYLILPTDLIPDIIPIVGKADDTTIFILEIIRKYLNREK